MLEGTISRVNGIDVMPNKICIFVPGLMGSELLTPKTRVPVWEDNVITVLSTLLFEPSWLDATRQVEVGQVMSANWSYGPFLSFLNSALAKRSIFLQFPYDWRQRTSYNASMLVDYMNQLLHSSNDQIEITLIGHSMGCLVIRAVGVVPGAPHANIKKIIEIAPPHRGSSKAFRMLHQVPEIAPIVKRGLGLLPKRLLRLAHAHMSLACRGVAGLWELIPPDSEQILQERGTGIQCGALGWPGWGPGISTYSGTLVNGRYGLYNNLITGGWKWGIDISLAVAKGLFTEYQFMYDTMPPHTIDLDNPFNVVEGDGTVIKDSAEWLKNLGDVVSVEEIQASHMEVLRKNVLQQWLLREIP